MSKKAPLFSFKYILYDLAKVIAWWQLLIFYRLNIKYDGEEAKKLVLGGAFIVSNHVAFSDPFILQTAFLYRRFHFLAMEELFSSKAISWIYKNFFLALPISRDKISPATIKNACNLAENGNIVALFPEGHINVDLDKVDDFKGGVILMAYKANVPIIPVYHQKRKSIWNMTRLVIGKPIDVRKEIDVFSQENIKKMALKLQKYEQELMEMCQKK